MNQIQKKQQKKLNQEKRNLKKQKEDLKSISISQKKMKKANISKEKGKPKKRLSFFGGKKKKSVQETIPYLRMLRNGICQVEKNKFNKMIRFLDINYQLSTEEDKESIFNEFSSFLNYFDPSVDIELSYINRIGKNEEVEKNINVPDRNDSYNEIRKEYREMLKNQSQKGNNGLTKYMYITFSLQAQDLKEATTRLERMEMDILNNFKQMGVKAYVLSGYERLKVIHDILNPNKNFVFSFEDLKYSGLSTKDYIVPASFNFSSHNQFKIGEYFGEVNFLQILAPELSDRLLSEFLGVEENMIVTFHINSIDQTEAIKMIKRKITDLDKMKIEENKKAIRSGYDIDILPSDLITYGNDAKKLLVELQNHNERMFVITILFTNMEKSRKKLSNIIFQLNSIAGRHNCVLKNLNYRQEQGLISSLPLGKNEIEIKRGLTTSSTAVFIPFTTEELCLEGESLYYGLISSILPSIEYELAFVALIAIFSLINRKIKIAFTGILIYLLVYFLSILIVRYGSNTFRSIFMPFLGLVNKIYPVCMLSMIILSTTKVGEFLSAMDYVGVSKKISIPLAVMLRYIPTIKEDWLYIKDSMRFRGISPSFLGFIKNPSLTVECIYSPMIIMAAKAADELTIASITRGIESPNKRTSIIRINFGILDYLSIIIGVIITAFTIYLRYFYD